MHPLILHAINGCYDLVEELIQKDTDIVRSEYGSTALMAALAQNHVNRPNFIKIAELLLKYNVDTSIDKATTNALMIYFRTIDLFNFNRPFTKLLIDKTKDLNERFTEELITPAMALLEKKLNWYNHNTDYARSLKIKREIIIYMISTGRLDVNVSDKLNKNLLMHAVAECPEPELIKQLLLAGAKLDIKTKFGNTYDLAKKQSDTKVYEYLRKVQVIITLLVWSQRAKNRLNTDRLNTDILRTLHNEY